MCVGTSDRVNGLTASPIRLAIFVGRDNRLRGCGPSCEHEDQFLDKEVEKYNAAIQPPKAALPLKAKSTEGNLLVGILGLLLGAGIFIYMFSDTRKLEHTKLPELFTWIARTNYALPEYVYKAAFTPYPVTIQPRPTDCEWLTAPLGDKRCHYQKHIEMQVGGKAVKKIKNPSDADLATIFDNSSLVFVVTWQKVSEP